MVGASGKVLSLMLLMAVLSVIADLSIVLGDKDFGLKADIYDLADTILLYVLLHLTS